MRSLLLLDLSSVPDGIQADAAMAVANATSLAGDALQRLAARVRTFVSLGVLDNPSFDGDLAVAARAPIDGIALPACRGGADVQHLAAKLAVAEAETGRPDGALGIMAFVAGTAGAVLDLGSLVGASPRLRALIFDGASLGLKLAADGTPFATARALTIITAIAASVPAYGQLTSQVVEVCCDTARRDGFAGLLTFDPDAVATINRLFPRSATPASGA